MSVLSRFRRPLPSLPNQKPILIFFMLLKACVKPTGALVNFFIGILLMETIHLQDYQTLLQSKLLPKPNLWLHQVPMTPLSALLKLRRASSRLTKPCQSPKTTSASGVQDIHFKSSQPAPLLIPSVLMQQEWKLAVCILKLLQLAPEMLSRSLATLT